MKHLILIALLLLFAAPALAQSETGSDEWYRCRVVHSGKGPAKVTCPRLEKESDFAKLRIVESIPSAAGTEFYLRRRGNCATAYTLAEQSHKQWERLPSNIDCASGVRYATIRHRKRR